MAIPSLAMIPSGYKDGKVYSVLPSNGDGDFTFSRGSNATRVNKDGLIETTTGDTPRLDYSDGSCPSLLLEPQSTNLVTYSEDFSNSDWTNTNVSLTSGFASPSGDLNAFKLINNSTASVNKYIRTIPSATSGIDYSLSVFAKKGEYDNLRIEDGNNSRGAWFDLSNGTFSAVGTTVVAKIEDYGNGWYKCSVSKPSVTTSVFFIISGSNSQSLQVGDGTSGVYIYGAQIEQGSFPTSYIPTNGATATRLADVCNSAGTSDTFNDSEGVLFVDSATLVEGEDIRIIGLSDGSTDNRISITYHSTENRVQIFGSKNGTTVFNLEYLNTIKTDYNKIAVKYNTSSVDFYYNGFLVDTEVPSDMFDANILNSLNFDRIDNNNNFYGKTKQVQYYNSALTDSEIEELTSWESFLEMAAGQNYTIK